MAAIGRGRSRSRRGQGADRPPPLSVRLSREARAELEAVAAEVWFADGSVERASDVNLSEFVREVLEAVVTDHFEHAPGGRDGVMERHRQRLLEEKRQQLEDLGLEV